jgi:predicted alpha-1,2-mannosidase
MLDWCRFSILITIIATLSGCGGDVKSNQPRSSGVTSPVGVASPTNGINTAGGTSQSGAGGSSGNSSLVTSNGVGATPAATSAVTPPATPAATSPAAPVVMALTQYVNPLIGTLASNSPYPVPAGQAGSVVPAAGLPSGMVQWAPDTNTTPAPSNSAEPGSPAGYYYDIGSIQSFSLTHMSGAGCSGNDGEFPVMPTLNATQSLAQAFSHSNETAVPGAYSVLLNNQIKVELTATLRTGFGRFTYPASQPAVLVLGTTSTNTRSSVSGTVTKVAADTISGSTTGGGFCGNSAQVPVYFYAQFDQPFASSSTISGGKAVLNFNSGATVQMKIGISYVSIANAQANLNAENPGWDFTGVKTAADTAWNTRLNAIQVSSTDNTALTKFYTAFYHTLWAPSIFSDVNGQYVGFDGTTHTVATGQSAQYSAFSGWDIYRSLIQLKAVLFPKETSDMVQSLVNAADQCGAIPHWVNDNVEDGVMPGDAGSLIVSSAYAFGATNFDAQDALAHMIQMANIPGTECAQPSQPYNNMFTYGSPGDVQTFLSMGHLIPGSSAATASGNLEYTSSHFAISTFAGALGNTTIQKMLLSHSAYWQDSLDTSLNPPLIAARTSSGSWLPESQNSTSDYTEGNAEQYTWMVPYNPAGLMAQLGGNTTVVSRLNTFFSQLNAGTSQPNFYMGNEPTFEVPWLYNWAGLPSGTQNVVQRIMQTAFGSGPNGLPGNDDLGAVSGWYVWGALGLYPEVPGVGGFAIGSPQFSSITVQLGNGNVLQINASGAPATNYVQSLAVNGTAQTSSWLPLTALANGATMNFVMGSTASQWGADAADAPPSFGVPVATSLADAFNNQGIAVDGSTNANGQGANFDGGLYAFSSTALATAGAKQGGPAFVVDGASFVLSSGPLDNAVAVGQTIMMPSSTKGSALVVLGSADDGPSSGPALITYSDGTTTPFTLYFDDWTLNGGSATATDTVALKTSYRNTGSGGKDSTSAYMFVQKVPLSPGKVVTSVTLPARANTGLLHVFGIAAAP